jgi:O-antigen/teichoic acid export membrane protein
VTDRAKGLFRNLAIYGLGDVATSLISLLLLPIYTRYLSPSDYGVIAMLLTVEAVVKVLFRWGVDTAFMRLYYDCPDQAARQRLASTLFFFLLAVNGAILAAAVFVSGALSRQLFGTAEQAVLIALVLANTFVAGFFFIPFQVLRIGEQPKQFIALVFARSAGTLLARLALVIGAGMGVLGIVLADIIITVLFTIVLSRWFAPLIRPVFSPTILADAVAFGLPRIPHSLAHHVMGLADRYFLNAFGTLRDVGLYSIGASFGLALKLFVSAFDSAWTPLYLGIMKEPDARQIISRLSTYAIGTLVCLVAGWCAIAPDVVRLATAPEFHDAARVTPWISLVAMFQGFYVIGSIGLIITKRTTLYPIATGIAALTSVAANVLLIPRYGLIGAAWATCLAYATLVVVTVGFSFRLYPIPYEWSRLVRIAIAGLAGYFGAMAIVPRSIDPLPGFFFHGTAALSIYTAVLFATGFFHQGELGELRNIGERALRRKSLRAPATPSTDTEMAGEIVSPSEAPDERLVGSDLERTANANRDNGLRADRRQS